MQQFYGSSKCIDQLKFALSSGRIANTWLFVGPTGVGKSTLAKIFAQALICPNQSEPLSPCQVCSSCKAVSDFDCPDFIYLLPDRKDITTDYINRTEIANKAYVFPSQLCKKIIFFDHAHYLNPYSANQLLKLFEETPASTIFILVTDKPQKMLPTILSRSQKVQMYPMTDSELLLACENEGMFRILAPRLQEIIPKLSQGRFAFARKLIDNPDFAIRLLKFVQEMHDVIGQRFSARSWILANEFVELVRTWSEIAILQEEKIQIKIKPDPKEYPEFYKGHRDEIKNFPLSTERKKELARIASHQILDWLILKLVNKKAQYCAIESCLDAKELINRNLNLLTVMRFITIRFAYN